METFLGRLIYLLIFSLALYCILRGFIYLIQNRKGIKDSKFNQQFSFLVRQEELRLGIKNSKHNHSSYQKKSSFFKDKELKEITQKLEWGSSELWNNECKTLSKKIKLTTSSFNYTPITQYLIQHFKNDLDQSMSKKQLTLFTLYLAPFYKSIMKEQKIRESSSEGKITHQGIALHLLINTRSINFESNFNLLASKLSQKDLHDYIANFILNKDFSFKAWSNFSDLALSLDNPFTGDDEEDSKSLFPNKTKKGIKASFKKLAKIYHPDKINLNLLPEKYHEEVKETISGYFKRINKLKDNLVS